MNDELPPLPGPVAFAAGLDANMNGYLDVMAWSEGEFTTPLYTSAQVEEIRSAAVLAERERCAKVCEEIETASWKEWKATYNTYHDGRSDGAGECAAAIRKETT